MRKRTKWVLVFAMVALSLGSAACEGCNNASVFVGDADVIEADIVEQAEERDNSHESVDLWPEEPTTDTPVEISEIDELEDEVIGCDTSAFEETAWSRVYATNDNTEPSLDYLVRETIDCSYIVAADSDESTDGTHSPWVLKFDRFGDIVWEKIYNIISDMDSYIRSLALTREGGYILGNHCSANSCIMRLDPSGDIIWHKMYYSFEGQGVISQIKALQGGGFAICGEILRGGGPFVDVNCHLCRFDEAGFVLWSKQLSGFSHGSCDFPLLEQLTGGDLIVAGNIKLRGEEKADIFVQRVDTYGATVWQKRYRRETVNVPVELQPSPDGGYVLVAYSFVPGEDEGDVWFMKMNADGGVVLQETIGGEMDDRPLAMAPVGDDGYVICGRTLSFGTRGFDSWLIRLNPEGNVLWQKSYGGAQPDGCSDIQPTTDGGFIVSGVTNSFGNNNLWIMKLDENGNISESCPAGLGIDTTAVVQETFAEAEDISIPVLDWDMIVDDLEIVPEYSFSAIETQCAR